MRHIGSISLATFLVLCFSYAEAFDGEVVESDQKESLFYGRLYPEWRVDRYFGGARAGNDVGNLGTLRNDTTVLANNVATKQPFSDWDWSNSYVGLRNRWQLPGWSLGFQYELLIDTTGEANTWTNLQHNLNRRDAYVYAQAPSHGKLAFGQMDSLYKAWGDRYRMLGISSGNFISTARILSQPGWRGSGDVSFHIRRANTLTYESPTWSGWQVGSSYSFNESESGPGGPGTRVWAYGLRYSDKNWYWAVAEEWHYGFLPMSQGITDPASTSIKRDSSAVDSRDRATRLSMGWQQAGFRIGADVAKMNYSEYGSESSVGKFASYRNLATQVTLQQRFSEKLSLAFSYAIASSGQCELTGGMVCSTHQLGGYQMNWGGMYHFNSQVGLFVLLSEIKNRPASRYGQTSQGSDLMSYATGVLVRFD